MEPPAIVTVTEHVPAPVTDKTPLVSLHPVAVPDVTTYDFDPPDEPPEVVKVRFEPNVPDVDVSVMAD